MMSCTIVGAASYVQGTAVRSSEAFSPVCDRCEVLFALATCTMKGGHQQTERSWGVRPSRLVCKQVGQDSLLSAKNCTRAVASPLRATSRQQRSDRPSAWVVIEKVMAIEVGRRGLRGRGMGSEPLK